MELDISIVSSGRRTPKLILTLGPEVLKLVLHLGSF